MRNDKHKEYIILAFYGYEGWVIEAEADSFDDIMNIRLTDEYYGYPLLIVKQVDYSLEEEL